MTEANQLPDKPSELIRVALDDLKKCEASPGYRINMNNWHIPLGAGTCEVCLAGAVMAQSLGSSPRHDMSPPSFVGSESKKLRALDCFRMGDAWSGTNAMGFDCPDLEDLVEIPEYRDDPEAFHKAMRALADDLEGAGL